MSTVGLILTGLSDLKFGEKKILFETLFVNDLKKIYMFFFLLHAKKGPFLLLLLYLVCGCFKGCSH